MLKVYFSDKDIFTWIKVVKKRFPNLEKAFKMTVEKEDAALPPKKRRRIDNGT